MKLVEALNDINKIYTDSVEEIDNEYPFLPEAYKTLTEKFVAKVEKELGVHIIDLVFLDGYYIYGYGTNSVVHFRVKECKGWKFGIWWNYNEEGHFKYSGELFAQYERAIDKFKPEDSQLIENIKVSEVENFEKDAVWTTMPIKMIKYIKDYPAFAFCRHWSGYNGKYDYMPYYQAKKELRKYNMNQNLGEFVNKALVKKIIRYIKWNFLRYLPKGWAIYDRGNGCYPRYGVAAPISIFGDLVTECGLYGYDQFDNFIPNVEKKLKRLKKFEKLENKLSKLKIFKTVWINGTRDIHATCFDIYNDKTKE